MTKILVVDDDPNIVRLVRGYLEQAEYSVFTAGTGSDAIAAVRRDRPDLIVLDLMLPDQDGWDITRWVRQDRTLKATPIIMLTARVDDTDKIIGLELGADDYLTKPFNPRELLARVRAQLRRIELDTESGVFSQVLEIGDIRMDLAQRMVQVESVQVDLTPTEFELLRVLMESPGYAFSREELIEKGLGYEYAGMGRTLDSHIKNLRRKIEFESKAPKYIQTVYGVGYRMVDHAKTI